MYLLIDIGNTRIKYSLGCDEKAQIQSVTHSRDFVQAFSRIFADLGSDKGGAPNISRILVSNVAGESAQSALVGLARSTFSIEPEFAKVVREFQGLKNSYKVLSQMGVDRWVALIGAMTLSELKPPYAVIDCGTAITVDIVNKEGHFAGGSILPGVEMASKSLSNADGVSHYQTDLTRLTLGQTTQECCSLGVLASCVGGMQTVLGVAESEFGTLNAKIITGGGSKLLMPIVKFDYSDQPYLIFKGLHRLFACD